MAFYKRIQTLPMATSKFDIFALTQMLAYPNACMKMDVNLFTEARISQPCSLQTQVSYSTGLKEGFHIFIDRD